MEEPTRPQGARTGLQGPQAKLRTMSRGRSERVRGTREYLHSHSEWIVGRSKAFMNDPDWRHKNRCLRTTLLAPAQAAALSPCRTSPRRHSPTCLLARPCGRFGSSLRELLAFVLAFARSYG